MSPCLGLDVAKNKVGTAILMDNSKFKNKGFAKTAKGFAELLTRLARYGAAQAPVCMECTGIFHEAVAACLYDKGHTVCVVNPQRIKSFGASEGIRAKNDLVDARLIARFGKLMQPQPRQPVPLEIRTLRAPGRRRDELIVMRTQESNRAGGNEELIEESLRRCRPRSTRNSRGARR